MPPPILLLFQGQHPTQLDIMTAVYNIITSNYRETIQLMDNTAWKGTMNYHEVMHVILQHLMHASMQQ